MSNGLLSSIELKQIHYFQKDSECKFGEIGVRRNFLTSKQVDLILKIQASIA